MDAIASIFVNYHEERRELVEKTEAADLIEQNVAELMQLCYRGASAGEFEIRTFPPGPSRGPSRSPRRARPTIASARASEPCLPRRAGMLDSTADVLAAAVLRDRSASRRSRARVLWGGGGVWRARARASDCTDTSFAPAGTEWKDDASAEDEGRSRKHLSARGAATPPDGFGGTSMVEASLAGRGSRGASRPSTGATCPSRGVRERVPGTDDARARPTRRVAALEPPLAQDVADRRRGRPRDAPARRGDGHPGPVRGAPRRARDRPGTVARRRPRLRPAQLLIQFVVLPRKMGTGRDSLEVRDPRPGPLAPRRAPRKRRKRRARARPRADGRERRHVLHRRRGDAQARAQAGPAPARRPASFERARRASTSSLPNDFDRRRARGPPRHGPLEPSLPVRVHPR